MKNLLCASTAALGLLLAWAVLPPAAAADLSVAPMYKSPPAPVATWTGSYIGVSGGGAWGNAVVHNNATGLDQAPRFDLSGGLNGVNSGVNVQNANVVGAQQGE